LTLQAIEGQNEGCGVPRIDIITCHLIDSQTWKKRLTPPHEIKIGIGGEGGMRILPTREVHPLSEEELRKNENGGGIPETRRGIVNDIEN